MRDPIAIVGAGGFGREVVNIIGAINAAGTGDWDLIGVVDDQPSDLNLQRLAVNQITYLGPVDQLLADGPDTPFVIAIGSPQTRRAIAERLESAGHSPAILVHPDATVGSATTLGPGSIICAGARLTTNITVGRHVHIDCNATVGHDTTLGDFVRLNPASSVSGDCVIEEDVLIGVAAAILNQLRIGAGATVGGSACVVRDVQSGATVKGVPAR